MSYPNRIQMQRRAEPRMPMKIPPRLAYGQNLARWADCTILDRSPSGSKVKIDAMYQLPPRVILTDLQTGEAFEAVIKWRRGDLAGMQFETTHDLNGDVEPRLASVRDTWLALRVPPRA